METGKRLAIVNKEDIFLEEGRFFFSQACIVESMSMARCSLSMFYFYFFVYFYVPTQTTSSEGPGKVGKRTGLWYVFFFWFSYFIISFYSPLRNLGCGTTELGSNSNLLVAHSIPHVDIYIFRVRPALEFYQQVYNLDNISVVFT